MRLLLLALVAAVAAGVMVWKMNLATERTCHSNLRAMETALAAYAHDHGGQFPRELAQLEGPEWHLPMCPATESSRAYVQGYRVAPDLSAYTLVCGGHWLAESPPSIQSPPR